MASSQFQTRDPEFHQTGSLGTESSVIHKRKRKINLTAGAGTKPKKGHLAVLKTLLELATCRCLLTPWRKTTSKLYTDISLKLHSSLVIPEPAPPKPPAARSGVVLQDYGYNDHKQKNDCHQCYDCLHLAASPPHLSPKLLGSVAKSCGIV